MSSWGNDTSVYMVAAKNVHRGSYEIIAVAYEGLYWQV